MDAMDPIGVFDSGIGGLTVLRELSRLMPGEDFVSLGDTARVPYGTKSAHTVIRYSLNNLAFLTRQRVKNACECERFSDEGNELFVCVSLAGENMASIKLSDSSMSPRSRSAFARSVRTFRRTSLLHHC